CVDVDYRGEGAVAACMLLNDWSDAEAAGEHVARIGRVEAYVPGQFYRRELPCLLAVLGTLAARAGGVVRGGCVLLAAGQAGGRGALVLVARRCSANRRRGKDEVRRRGGDTRGPARREWSAAVRDGCWGGGRGGGGTRRGHARAVPHSDAAQACRSALPRR